MSPPTAPSRPRLGKRSVPTPSHDRQGVVPGAKWAPAIFLANPKLRGATSTLRPRGLIPQRPLPPQRSPVLTFLFFSASLRLIVSPEKKSNIVLGFLILPPKRGVAWGASQRSKHLLPLLLERASRRYEFRCPALLCLRGAVRTAGCAWFQKRILRRFPFLDFTIRLSPEPSQPLRRGV
jgi:hypothetical protein